MSLAAGDVLPVFSDTFRHPPCEVPTVGFGQLLVCNRSIDIGRQGGCANALLDAWNCTAVGVGRGQRDAQAAQQLAPGPLY